MRVCYFGELDPYTGSFPNRLHALPELVATLKLLVLLHDVVILPPGSLLEHALALPAFEELAPLVRAGRLGTSADRAAPPPPTYFERRIERTLESQAHARRETPSIRWRRDEARRLRDRWLALLPKAWAVRRDVSAQVGGLADGVLAGSQDLRAQEADAVARHLEDFLLRTRDAGVTPLRDHVLAFLGELRGDVPREQIQRAAALVQNTYFAQGVARHDVGRATGDGCVLFPGLFASVARHADLVAPWDDALRDGVLRERAERLGVDLAALLQLSVADVLELAASDEWQALATALRGQPEPPAEVVEAVRARLAGRDIRDALPGGAEALGSAALAPRLLPPPWQLAAYGLLGSLGATEHGAAAASPTDPPTLELDWSRRELRSGIRPREGVALTPAQTHLLTLLAIAGEVGLSLEELRQALRELDLLAFDNPDWQPAPPHPTEAAGALRNRLDVEKSKLEQLLSPMGHGVEVSAGRWRLRAPERFALVGTPWQVPTQDQRVPAPPEALSPQMRRAWRVLARHMPSETSAARLAQALGWAESADAARKVSRAIHRLRSRLEQSRQAWTVHADQLGSYRLLPLPGDEEPPEHG
ncbi:MAG: hypothetical protein ACQEXJ_20955 [Myxococcota bacterium]